jgi:type III restriction enzyme
LRYYYPDFVVRLVDGACLILETKGMEDIEVALKDHRARRWCRDASALKIFA